MAKVYKDCWFTILNAHEIGVDNDGWEEGVFIPFDYVDFVFVHRMRNEEPAKELSYIEDKRTGERYYVKVDEE